jgi:hypothetical protein
MTPTATAIAFLRRPSRQLPALLHAPRSSEEEQLRGLRLALLSSLDVTLRELELHFTLLIKRALAVKMANKKRETEEEEQQPTTRKQRHKQEKITKKYNRKQQNKQEKAREQTK